MNEFNPEKHDLADKPDPPHGERHPRFLAKDDENEWEAEANAVAREQDHEHFLGAQVLKVD